MGMKKGFQLTELGWIPEDWEVKKLNDISEKIMVGIASAATHAYRERGIIMFRNQNIKSNFLDDEDILFIAPDYEQIYKNKRLRHGDLLTARTGYPGTTCIVPEKYEGAQSFTTLITRLKNESIRKDFACFYINSEIGQAFFEANQIGGGQKNVNAGTLKKMPIPFPSLPEQTAIATVLSATDALLNSLDTMLTKKRNLKQATMQRLLTPGEGWVVKKLGDIGECFIGLTYKPSDVVESGLLVLRSSNIGDNRLKYGDNVYVSVDVTEKLIVQHSDILICVRNGSRNLIGKCALIAGSAVGHTFGAFMAVFRSPYNEYIFHVFQSSIIKRQIEENIGATINQITNKNLNSFEIPFPNKSEQTRIATILTDLDRDIEALERKIAKYKALKTGLMQNLLTGKIRLPVATEATI